MITINEAKKYLEKTMVKLEGMPVEIKVMDVRQVYNRVDALITTKNGGQKWIDASRLY